MFIRHCSRRVLKEDSVLLWKSVVSNQLLAKTNLVLFLNKCDVLRAKLRAGIRLGKYVISYGDRPNDFEHASECKPYSASLTPPVACRSRTMH